MMTTFHASKVLMIYVVSYKQLLKLNMLQHSLHITLLQPGTGNDLNFYV